MGLNVADLLTVIAEHPAAAIRLMLPDGRSVPPNFHVTEIGLVRKDFIDCGGTIRSASACVVQAWVADDVDHRLDTTKLGRIFDLAATVLKSTDLPVEVEYENGTVSQYPLDKIETTPAGILLRLGEKHTRCLAPQLCGVLEDRSCCGSSNCC